VTALDHGLTVGDGVFEVVKAVAGRPFALDLHLERMARSAAGLGLPALDADAVRRGVTEVLGAERLPFAKVRATWTGGPSPLGSGRGAGPPSLVVVSDAMDPWPETAAVVSVPWPRNERGALAGLKTTSYGENVRALARAREHGASEGIFANLQGWLCEGTGTNVFYVLDGQLRTPTLRSGCLAGITRHLVLEWYGAVETDAPIEEILHASEVFLTSTTRDVQGVHRWDQRELTAPGPVTTEVKKMWQDRQGELLGG
jgi:branched-chain amino acid aminotransferase